MNENDNAHSYRVIADIIDYLVENCNDRPELSIIAKKAGYEKTHFQKMFKAHVGISPSEMLRYMHLSKVSNLLEQGHSSISVANEAGLSSTSRLHDLCVNYTALTPGDIKRRGEGLEISYSWHSSKLGQILVGRTDKGICWLSFLLDGDTDKSVSEMKSRLPAASWNEEEVDQSFTQDILALWRGEEQALSSVALDIYGTNFQVQVWQALLQIPYGKLVSYSDIAIALDRPKANRAVGSAIGKNPVSLLIPCHRVIQSAGIIENYAWGTARKRLLIGMEVA